jgi:hypothetical protein
MHGDADGLIDRWQRLKSLRLNYDTTWQRVTELVWPFAGDFVVERSVGERRTDEIFESTAAIALERFAAFLESLLTPRNQIWHRLSASLPELNEIQRVKEWFDTANNRLFQVRNNPTAHYYSQMHEGYKSLGAFGNDTLMVEAIAEGGIRYKHCHLGTTHIETDHNGVPSTVYYAYKLSAYQALTKWGDNAPDIAKAGYKVDPLQMNQYLHTVRPRNDFDPQRRDALGMEFESTVISVDDRYLVEEGGYDEQPYLHSRYTVNPSEMYGRGPAELILPDIETLQEQEKTFQRAGHKVADPPLLLQSDGPLGRGQTRVKLSAGGLTYGGLDMQGRPTVVPLQTGGNLPLTESMMEQKREMISTAFLNSLFLSLVDNHNMTATEVLERAKEKGQLLTPTTGRQESEKLGPQIQREIRILQRQGQLPPPPPELLEAAGEFDIIYDNEAARLQRTDDALSIQKTLDWIMLAVSQGADQSLMELPDWHEAAREIGEINGMPAKLWKDKEQVEAAMAAIAERGEQEAMLEMGAKAAAMSKDAKDGGIDMDQMAGAV